MSNDFVQHKWIKKTLKFKKGRYKGIYDFINCASTFLFFHAVIKLGIFMLHKIIPKKMLKTFISTNALFVSLRSCFMEVPVLFNETSITPILLNITNDLFMDISLTLWCFELDHMCSIFLGFPCPPPCLLLCLTLQPCILGCSCLKLSSLPQLYNFTIA